MSIIDLLDKLDIEVVKAKNDEKCSPARAYIETKSFNTTVDQIVDYYGEIRKKANEINDSWNLIKKAEIKKELINLLSLFQQYNEADGIRYQKVNNHMLGIMTKYGITIPNRSTRDELNKESRTKTIHSQANGNVTEKVQKLGAKKIISGPVMESLSYDEVMAANNNQVSSVQLRKQKEIFSKTRELHGTENSKQIISKNIHSMENRNKVSIKDKINSKVQKTLELKEDKVFEVRYELQNNAYYVDGRLVLRPSHKLVTPEEKEMYLIAALKGPTGFNYVFDNHIRKERNAYKYCDPYIIEILASKDLRLAKDYVRQMCGSKEDPVAPGKFDVIYDARGMEKIKSKDLSRSEKSGIRKVIKHIKGATTILQDKKRLPWYASIPVVGALALAAISGGTVALNQGEQHNDKDLNSGNSYTDNVEPSTETEVATQTTTSSLKYTTAFDYETTTTEATTSRASSTTETTTTKIEETQQETTTTENQKPIVINIGDKINVQEGLKYTADCLGGGNSNEIGAVSWRPAAEYSVDRVAFVYQGKVLDIMNAGDCNVKQTLQNLAAQNGIDTKDINTSVLLSLVPGIGDTGWAQISVEDMEQNVSKVAEKSNQTSYARVNIDIER